MNIHVTPDIFEMFPALKIGVVVARGIDNEGSSADVSRLLDEAMSHARRISSVEELDAAPTITSWRAAYAKFQAKPKKYRSSVESLYQMLLAGRRLPSISKLVDIYNAVSVKHVVPVGGDDIDRVEGDILLKRAAGNEPFVPLNGAEVEHPKPGEVVYVDDKDVLCRRWNWRECQKTQFTAATRNAILMIEGLESTTAAQIRAIADELAASIQQHCGGETRVFLMDGDLRTLDID